MLVGKNEIRSSCRSLAIRHAANALIVAAVTMMIALSAGATAFKSFNGGFAIDLPEGWHQVDYRTADYHLKQAEADMEYEGLFSGGTGATVFGDRYLIITVDTLGVLTDEQVDSVLAAVGEEFNKTVQLYAGDAEEAYISEQHIDKVAFDTVNNVAAVVTTLWEANVKRKNVLALKFYDKGVANFYFYSPDSSYGQGLSEFRGVLASFTTDVTTRATDTQPVKIADLDQDDGPSVALIIGAVAVIAIVVIVVVASRRRRQGQ